MNTTGVFPEAFARSIWALSFSPMLAIDSPCSSRASRQSLAPSFALNTQDAI